MARDSPDAASPPAPAPHAHSAYTVIAPGSVPGESDLGQLCILGDAESQGAPAPFREIAAGLAESVAFLRAANNPAIGETIAQHARVLRELESYLDRGVEAGLLRASSLPRAAY